MTPHFGRFHSQVYDIKHQNSPSSTIKPAEKNKESWAKTKAVPISPSGGSNNGTQPHLVPTLSWNVTIMLFSTSLIHNIQLCAQHLGQSVSRREQNEPRDMEGRGFRIPLSLADGGRSAPTFSLTYIWPLGARRWD
ncbi:hypothetical protein XENTR_v10003629 [Xenopus tropicalis]|nr:hypothetical protein XENTR_v10003629 [Xenopus tropicalis]